MSDVQQCWLDDAGDLLEKEGVDPGCIFEFHDQLTGDLQAGGVVVSTLPPGVPPTLPTDISRVLLRDIRGELHDMSPQRLIFLFNFHLITGFY